MVVAAILVSMLAHRVCNDPGCPASLIGLQDNAELVQAGGSGLHKAHPGWSLMALYVLEGCAGRRCQRGAERQAALSHTRHRVVNHEGPATGCAGAC